MITVQKFSVRPFEVVERKGLGHPDTLADGISESISRRLSRLYLDEFGEIMHHNVDKVLIVAGKSSPKFGGGFVLTPPAVVVGGRATVTSSRNLSEAIEDSTSRFLRSTIEDMEGFTIEPRVGEGAPELQSLIGKGANDTSIGVGFAPLDSVEKLVLEIEPRVRSVKGVGKDTKIMAVRMGSELKLVIAAAMVSKHISSMEDYLEAKAKVRDEVMRLKGLEEFPGTEVSVNAADSGDNIFLTVTGTSIEMGDDGATGRGNRGSGLITPMRPMTMEAIAGKNPVSHVGKIYNVLASRIASEISELKGVKEAYVTLVSKIGSPIDEPLLKGVEIAGDLALDSALNSKVYSIIDYWLGEADALVEEFVEGKIAVY